MVNAYDMVETERLDYSDVPNTEDEPTADSLHATLVVRYSLSNEEKGTVVVGGESFYTSLRTLTRDPITLFSKAIGNGELSNGMLKFDRDPKHFRHVLTHLRKILGRTLESYHQTLAKC